MRTVRCVNCKKSTKGFRQYCGNCGAPIETSHSPINDQTTADVKPKSSIPRKTVLIVAISAALALTTATILWLVLGQKELNLGAKVVLPKESTLWLDEPFKIQGIVQSNAEMPKGWTYELIDRSGQKIKVGSITEGARSFKFEVNIQRMGRSAQYSLNIFSESREIKFSTRTPIVHAVTTSLPSSCNLPTLEKDYGTLEESRAGTDWSGVYDMSTFYCDGDTVGSWMNSTFIGIGPQVDYSDQSYYEPKRNRYQDWIDQVEYQLGSPPYDYVQTTLNDYQVLYDCYIPNEGEPQDMAALINVHGVVIDYWNEGCLEGNTKYILEAAANVPVKSLK